jgi:hypothetical protein
MATTTRTQQEPGLVTGLFTDKDSSERAYETLRARGYSDDEIDVIMSEETRNKYYANDPGSELGNKAAEGAGVGGAIGAGLGAVIGGIAAIGTNLVLPGIGLVVWGPIAAAVAGAGAGGITGGLAGALIGMGIPEDRAKLYETGIKEGGTVMGVTPRTPEDAAYFENEWKTGGGQHIYR